MPPVDPEALSDPEPIALARTLREAKRVEALLTQFGIDYAVQVEAYGRSLFGSLKHGALFYVTAAQASYCRTRLSDSGFGKTVIEDDQTED